VFLAETLPNTSPDLSKEQRGNIRIFVKQTPHWAFIGFKNAFNSILTPHHIKD